MPCIHGASSPLSHINKMKCKHYQQGDPKLRRCLSQFLREAQKQLMHTVLNTTDREDFIQNSVPFLSVCFIQSPSKNSHKPYTGFPLTAFPPASLASEIAFIICFATPTLKHETPLIPVKGGSQQNRSVPTLNSLSLHTITAATRHFQPKICLQANPKFV